MVAMMFTALSIVIGFIVGAALGAYVMSAAFDTAIANLNAAADRLIAKANTPVDDSAQVAAVDAVTTKIDAALTPPA